MTTARPRIAILGIHLESNAFAPVTSGDDFRASCYFEGEAMMAEAAKTAPAMPAEMAWRLFGDKPAWVKAA